MASEIGWNLWVWLAGGECVFSGCKGSLQPHPLVVPYIWLQIFVTQYFRDFSDLTSDHENLKFFKLVGVSQRESQKIGANTKFL